MAETIPREAPYGAWRSPIGSDLVAAAGAPLGGAAFDGEDVTWSRLRPAEGGRTTLYRRTPDGVVREVVPAKFDVRSAVHEYGGGAWTSLAGGVVFAHFADQRLYRVDGGGEPRALTPESGGKVRYADLTRDHGRGRLLAVREDHRPSDREPVATIVALDPEGPAAEGTVLVSGADFYRSPRPSPDGRRLAWVEWDHPDMPWDASRLMVAAVRQDGTLGEARQVAGGPNESVQQPCFSPTGRLAFVSDRSGWWNPYVEEDGEVRAACPREEEFGLPGWTFGVSTLAFAGEDRLVCLHGLGRRLRLATVDLGTGALHDVPLPFEATRALSVAPDGRHALVTAGGPTRPDEIVRVDLDTGMHESLATAGEPPADAGFLSVPERIEFPTENGLSAFAYVYPPVNRAYRAPDGDRPPLLVKSHGGPTSAASITLNLETQYWTSRGFMVADVDYGGSSGYGRAYRERLKGNWGIVDVDDCCHAARHLVAEGRADPERLCIRGGSAGGYTTLSALAFRDVFHAGCSRYGLSDLETFARGGTHKFESRYLESLVGPYPEVRERYRARSPLHHLDGFDRPVIFFQGDEDAVVPPEQTEPMVEALRAKGVPVAYVLFEGEQHGFRRAEHIRTALDGELSFYAQVFGFEPADDIEPIPTENL